MTSRPETLMYPLAKTDDEAMLLEMAEAFHVEDGHPLVPSSREAIRALLGGSSLGRFHFIEATGVRIGYFALCFTMSIEFGGVVVILDDLYLRPEFRGRGVGSRVLAEVERMAREKSAVQVFLEVEHANARAFALYEKTGYVRRDRHMMAKGLRRDADA